MKIIFERSDSISLRPDFVTLSCINGGIGDHFACISSVNGILLEKALGDVLPSKTKAVPVTRRLMNRVEYGWHFHFWWEELENYENKMRSAGGYSAFLRSKKLIA